MNLSFGEKFEHEFELRTEVFFKREFELRTEVLKCETELRPKEL